MNAKTNLLHFLTIGPLQLAIHVVQNRYAGELGRSALGQDKQTAHFIKVVISYVCLLSMRVLDSLPFLWTNHSVHGLGTDGKQNSVLVNFFPESAFTICVQISFIYRRTEAKTLNWYQRWLWRKETRLEKQKNLYRHSAAPGNFPLKFLEKSSGVPLPVLSNCIFVNRSLRASSPIWASEASRAKTRERAAKPLVRSRETRFACPNRGACSQAM